MSLVCVLAHSVLHILACGGYDRRFLLKSYRSINRASYSSPWDFTNRLLCHLS